MKNRLISSLPSVVVHYCRTTNNELFLTVFPYVIPTGWKSCYRNCMKKRKIFSSTAQLSSLYRWKTHSNWLHDIQFEKSAWRIPDRNRSTPFFLDPFNSVVIDPQSVIAVHILIVRKITKKAASINSLRRPRIALWWCQFACLLALCHESGDSPQVSTFFIH